MKNIFHCFFPTTVCKKKKESSLGEEYIFPHNALIFPDPLEEDVVIVKGKKGN